MVASSEIQVRGSLFGEIFFAERKQKVMSRKTFFPHKSYVAPDIRLPCVARKMFIGVTAPKIRLNKSHENMTRVL